MKFVKYIVALTFLTTVQCSKTQNISDLAASKGTFEFTTSSATLPDGYRTSPYTYNFGTNNGKSPVAYAVSSGSMPGGLSLSSEGVLSGTITGNLGAYHFTVAATDSDGQLVSQSFSLTIRQPFYILTTSVPAATANAAYSSVITAQGGTTPYNFAATGLPTGLSIGAVSGLISGTPTVSGNFTVHLTVTDQSGVEVESDISFSVFTAVGQPSISTSSLATGTLGTAYADAVAVSGGMTPYTYAISAGSLPPGLSINPSTGVITGTPSTTGVFGFTVRATDNLSAFDTRVLSITIGASAAPTFSTSTLIDGDVSSSYRDVVQGTGGTAPYSFSITSGSLPAGLSLSSTTGLITGTPTVSGTSNFILKITDALSSYSSQSFSIIVNAPPTPSITSLSMVGGQLTVGYVDVVTATGGTPPYTFSITSGALPNGLTLDATTGKISGTPTVQATFNFTARVTDSLLQTASQALSIVVAASPVGPLSIQTTTLLPIVVDQNNNRTVTATGGLPPYTYSISAGALPTGVTLTSSTGSLNGIPTATGTSAFTIRVTDSQASTATQALSLVVVNPLTISTSSVPFAVTSTAYSTTISATGGTPPFSWAATGLPTGLSIAAGTGTVSGSPSVAGVASATVTVTDANGLTNSRVISFNVVDTVGISASATLRTAITKAYSWTPTTTGGQAPYTYTLSSGSLPSGLSLNSSTGAITGTPTKGTNLVTGNFSFTIGVTDTYGQTASRAFTMTVTAPPIIIADGSFKLRTVGRTIAYSDWVKRSGGYGAITYSATGLPTGLSIDATSGRVYGTATAAAGDYTVAFTATDAYGFTSTVNKLMKVSSSALTFGFDGPSIAAMPNSTARGNIIDINHGDLNGDGCVDAVANSYTSKEVLIYLNTKTSGTCMGTFTLYPFTPSGFPRSVVIADFNGDSLLDIAVSEDSTGGNAIEVVAGTATTDNGWTTPNSQSKEKLTTNVNGPAQITLGDINGDTRLDIVVANASGGNIVYFLNCGGATTNYNGGTPACTNGTPNNLFPFYPVAFALPASANNNPQGVGLSDLDADGALDLVVGSYGSAKLTVFKGQKTLGTPNGTFNSTLQSQIAGYNYGYVRTHLEPTDGWSNTYWSTSGNFINMNGDSFNDIVVQANTVGVIALNDGLANLTANYTADVSDLTIAAPAGAYVKVADLNNDTYPDLVMSNTNTGKKNINVFFNATGSGSLSGRRTFTDGFLNVFTLGIFTTGATRPAYLGARAWSSAAGYAQLLLRLNTNTSTAFNGGTFYYAYTSPTGVLQDLGSGGMPLVADINSDGYPDVVIRQSGTGTVSTFFGSSTGSLTSQSKIYPLAETGSTAWFGRQLALSDVDGDGYLDLASANYNSTNYSSVTLSLGNGDGTFGSMQYIPADGSGCTSGLGAGTVNFGDFNRDSRMDMAVGLGCNSQAKVNIFYGNGDGTFSNAANPYVINVPQGSNVDNMLVIDHDGDGNLDLAVASRNGYVMMYQGAGDGTFTLRSTISAGAGSNVSALDAGDVNADGYPDILLATAASGSSSLLTGAASLVLNAPTTFGGLAIFNFTNVYSAGFADYDNDGKLDIVIAKQYLGIQVLTGANNGNFTNGTSAYALANPGAYMQYLITLFDMNGDGLPDIVSTNTDTNQATSLSLNFNRCQ